MQLSAENQKLLNVTPSEMRERAKRRSSIWFGKRELRNEPPQEPKPHTGPLVILSDDEYVAQFIVQTPIIRSTGNPIPIGLQNKVKRIQKVVAQHFHISRGQMLSRRRNVNVCHPRQLAMYLAKIHTQRSLGDIGDEFGLDHTTVLHAAQKYERLVEQDDQEQLRVDVAAIERELA